MITDGLDSTPRNDILCLIYEFTVELIPPGQ